MVNGEAIRTNGTRSATSPNGLCNKVRGERGQCPVKRTTRIEVPLDQPGTGVGGMGNYGGELFIKCSGYVLVRGEGVIGKGDGLVGGRGWALTREGLEE